ncbi:MAG TPA: MFS transporter [Casimicrobiaceae bacterium]
MAVAVQRDYRLLSGQPTPGLTARYAVILRMPDVVRILALTFLARMPIGTLTLSMLLHVRALFGSFAVAGTTVGAYLTASAVAAPLVGRWVDKRGVRVPLALTGILYPVSVGSVLFAESLGLSVAGVQAAAVCAGVFAPPVSGLTRTILRQRFTDTSERRTAFALDSVLVEMVFTVGPLLVAAMIATGSPHAALGMSWIFTLASVPLFVASRALRYLPPQTDAARSLLGPLADLRLLHVFALTIVIAFGFGCIEVGYPGFGVAMGAVAMGGVLLACNSVGSALGGFAYGGLHMGAPPQRILPRVLAIMVLPLALHTLTMNAALLCVLAFCSGALIAPALTSVMLVISAEAPERYATEAFTWSSTCILGGLGFGAMVAGRVVQAHGPQMVLGLAACTMTAAALLAWRLQSLLQKPRTP